MSTGSTPKTNLAVKPDDAKLGQSAEKADRSVKPSPPKIEFRRLGEDCPRGVFTCGNPDIDKWFNKDALDHHKDLKARCVTGHLVGDLAPVAFYAMTLRLSPVSELGAAANAGTRQQRGLFMSVQLCYVAVQRDKQRQGIGTIMMGAAIDDFYQVARRIGIFAMTLQAIDQDTAKFYAKLGFVQYGNPHAAMPSMLLPARSVIDTVENINRIKPVNS